MKLDIFQWIVYVYTACMQQHSKNTWGKVSKMRLSSPSLNIVVTPRQPSVNAVRLF